MFYTQSQVDFLIAYAMIGGCAMGILTCLGFIWAKDLRNDFRNYKLKRRILKESRDKGIDLKTCLNIAERIHKTYSIPSLHSKVITILKKLISSGKITIGIQRGDEKVEQHFSQMIADNEKSTLESTLKVDVVNVFVFKSTKVK